MMSDPAFLSLAALGGVVWLAIFVSAKLSVRRIAALKKGAVEGSFEEILTAEFERVFEEERDQPPLPTLSIADLIAAERRAQRTALLKATSTVAKAAAQRAERATS